MTKRSTPKPDKDAPEEPLELPKDQGYEDLRRRLYSSEGFRKRQVSDSNS